MDIGETLYVTDRTSWREWLEANFDTKEVWLVYPNKAAGEPRILYNDAVEEVWLVYPKKAAGEPRILYNDAVEEALCFDRRWEGASGVFEARLRSFLRATEKGKQLGYGGIEKYF